MKKVLIKNGLLFSPVDQYFYEKKDLLIEDGRIKRIESEIIEDCETIDVHESVITPGFIDIHTHCFSKCSLGVDPDVLGIERGATTIFDAGSSGARNYEEFKVEIDKAKTKVYTLLNVSSHGLIHKHELSDLNNIEIDEMKKTITKYQDNIIGLKARASVSVVGEQGIVPIQMAADISKEVDLPLMVHIGNQPPKLEEVLALLKKNDIVTHAFHGKKGGILDQEGKIIKEALAARERGVLFDIGHGEASFSFDVYEKSLLQQFDCDCISSDLHKGNYQDKVINLAHVIEKALVCGESFADAINKVTSIPARIFHLEDIGRIKVGYLSDLNVINIENRDEILQDSEGVQRKTKKKIKISKTFYSKGAHCELFERNI